MITDSEFVMIRQFDRTLRYNTDSAQRIINDKNALLVSHGRRIAAQNQRIADLEAALVAERAKTTSLLAQLKRFMALH